MSDVVAAIEARNQELGRFGGDPAAAGDGLGLQNERLAFILDRNGLERSLPAT